MPYCPRCLTEYVEGSSVCEDCRVPLQVGSPPSQVAATAQGAAQLEASPDAKLVRIRTFSGPTALLDADVARNILQAEGIPSLVQGRASAELLPFLDVPLLVPAEQAERAAEILKGYFDSSGVLPEA